MEPVVVRILHRDPAPPAGPLELLVADARRRLAHAQAASFARTAAADVAALDVGVDSFGAALAAAVAHARNKPRAGLVLLGSGSIPLATVADLRRLVDAAATADGPVLANNRYSGDVVAIPRAGDLPALPDLPGDNALPRWLEECAGRRVEDLRPSWRLQVDVDGPLDLLLLDAAGRLSPALRAAMNAIVQVEVLERLSAVRAVLADRRAEAVLAGRVSTSSLRWFEATTASRTRVLIEERGLRAASPLALVDRPSASASARPAASRPARPPRSTLGMLLDRDGPASLGRILAGLGDAALVDSRVLLAHRLGADERRWPAPEDRFASDLLLPDRVADPWLRTLTTAALEAPIPVLLGGHSLVGPGLRLVAPRRGSR